MTKKPESRLQRRIRSAIENEFGGFWIKIWGGPFQQAGFPDLLGCIDGKFYAIEVKMPGEEPSVLQEETIQDINDAGGHATWVTSVEEALEFIRSTR